MDWAPGQNTPASGKGDDCSNCHTTPKNLPGAGFQKNNTWFVDSLKGSKVLDPADRDALKAWLSDSQFPTISAPPAAKVEAKPTVKPGAPADAAALNDQAKELERQGRLSMDPEQKTRFYQSALSFRLLSGDDSGATTTLNELEGIYKKSNSEIGQKFVAATRLWVEGKPDDALQALAKIHKEAQAAGWAFAEQYGNQRSLLLQTVAGEKLKSKDYPGAIALLKEALTLTPSDQLTSRILKLKADHNEADLARQKRNISDLEVQRENLTALGTPCAASCHTSTQNKLDDFDSLPRLTLNGSFQAPDLSAYRGLKLSYQQKMQLYKIDSQLEEARQGLKKSSTEVDELLFIQKLNEPNADLADFEAKFLKDAKAFDGPDRALAFHLAGEAYLAKKDWAKAATVLQSAIGEDPSLINAQFSLGQAQFANGDFKASRDAYTEVLKHQPQDVSALRYRADANTHYLKALDPKIHSKEIARVNDELASDRALLTARLSANEKSKLVELGKKLELLHEGGEADLATRKETLEMMELMAKQYLAMAETKQPNVASAEWVRKEMNGLASQTFELLAKFAKADSDPAIKKMAGVYEGYGFLAQGKIDEAVKLFEPLRAEVPEVEKILGTLEKNKLRTVNLAALDAWVVFNKEGSAIQADNQNGIIGKGIGLIEGAFRKDGKDFRDDTKARWEGQVAFVAELKSKIESGKADTILEAMKLIEANGPEAMKKDARYYINYEDQVITGYPLGALVHLVDKLPPEKGEAETLLRKTWDLERQNAGAIEGPYALYTLVNALDTEAYFNGSAREHMDALEGHGGFGRSAFKFITSMSPESLAVDVALMVGSAGLGNIAKLAALSKLEKAGVTGYKALFIAGAVGVGTEATALWAANLGKEAMTKDPSKVFTQDHMLKSYGATLIMIGGLKGFGALGEGLAPRAAKSLGLVTEGGAKLSMGGKVLSWGIGHGMGLTGMIATSHANQALGLTPKPVGGWKEGLVHDVFGYVQFAVAHKMANAAFGGKLSTISQKQHTEIAVKEAILLAKSQADTLGFTATRNAKGELVDSPARQILVGLLVDASLNKPGFSGGKLAKLVESKKLSEANDYFAEFGLPLEYSKTGDLVAVARGEASPHEAAGIPAGKAKPISETVNDLLDMAANFLFPFDGDGSGGLATANGAPLPTGRAKAEPQKGPTVVYMAGRNRGEGSRKGSDKTPIDTKVETVDEKPANDNQYYEIVNYTLTPGKNIDAALLELSSHFNDPTNIIVIKCERPVDNAEALRAKIAAFDASARIEIHQPGGRASIEVPGKTRMDQIHPDAATDGNMLMWDATGKSVRDLFELKSKKGEISLKAPEGVVRIEITADKPLSGEDISYLLTKARDLRNEANLQNPLPLFTIEVVAKGRKLHFEATEHGLTVRSDKATNAEEVSTLIDAAFHMGERVDVVTPDGTLQIQNSGSSTKESKVTTSDAKAAAAVGDKAVLQLKTAPSAAELQAMKDQGVKRILIQDDPSSPGWFGRTLDSMKVAKGIQVQVVDAQGKSIWESVTKSTGDGIQIQSDALQKAYAAQAKSGAPLVIDKVTPDQLDALSDCAAKTGATVVVKTEAGNIEIQGKLGQESKIVTKEAKVAAALPDKVVLQLDKAPSEADISAMKSQGIKRVVFQDDPSSPTWFTDSLRTIQASKGLSIQARNAAGELIWENVAKDGVDTLNAPSAPFLRGLDAHAKASGWKDRFAETQKLLGPDAKFPFTADALRWAMSHDLADASVPKGAKNPTVSAEQFEAWILRGTQLANTKLASARGKSDPNTRLIGELEPFSEGLNVDPSKPNGWTQAASKLKDLMAKGRNESELVGKLFQALNREAPATEAYENNAFDLAQHLQSADNPYMGIKAAVDISAKSSGSLKIQGPYFGSCFKKSRDTGAQAEFDTLNDMITQAGILTAQGNQVVIEAIPTSKMLDGVTPDFAITVSKGTSKARYIVEVKRAGSETVAMSMNEAGFRAELEAGFRGTKAPGDKSTLGSLMGKGLYQLSTYRGKNPGDNLVLNVRLNAEAPDYVAKAVKDYIAANCQGVVVKFQFQKMKAEAAGVGRTRERVFETSEVTIRADGATKYVGYDSNPNFFAPSIAAAEGK